MQSSSRNLPKRALISGAVSLCWFLTALFACAEAAPPNVVLIMTDDQGYGDLSCLGNPVLRTPHLDQLYAESVRFTDFHVSPFCTPTRAALMTGRYPARTGAYRTSSGRTMMHPDERTVANLFADNGYTTGMVGKWHLGDNAPHRPQDRGFQHAVWHRCGGVGQASDYWGNDYFDDTYEVVSPRKPGEPKQFKGYCTDVWFAEATRFVEENQEQPFFLYLAPNAPHGPYRVPDKWKQPYDGKETWRAGAEFYGMVANIDHNVGLLRKRLAELALADNTIFIFMTDNGTANGAKFRDLTSEAMEGFNAGMRGKKSSVYEGGHRVPFFVHWPAGGIVGGRDVSALAAHLDVLPTLAELCSLTPAKPRQLDGHSVANLIRDSSAKPNREHLIVQFQGGPYFRGEPKPWEYTCVLKDRWRLLDGKELYDIQRDPAQRSDVSAAHPDVVQQLRGLYPPFWESVSPRMNPVAIDLGSESENPTTLCSQDWYMPTGNPPWNFGAIQNLPAVTGPWNVNVCKAGRYRITLRQWPREANKPIKADRAEIQIGGQVKRASVTPGATGVQFEMELPAGRTELRTRFYAKDTKLGGAYFTDVEAIESLASLQARREEIRQAMQSVMGPLPGNERRVELEVRIEEEVDAGNYVRRLITFQSEPDSRTPAYLCIPKLALDGNKNTPAVLCLHPTDNQVGHQVVVGLAGRKGRQYAAELAEQGFVTIAPAYPHLANYWPNLGKLGYVSGSMKAIWDNTRALDVLSSLPQVDDARGFGVIGHSLGGHNAIFTAVLDERISVLVTSCGFDSFVDYYDGAESNWYFGKGWCQLRYMPRMSDFRGSLETIPFDFPGLIAGLAPRKVFINAPLHDTNFRWKSVANCVKRARPVYELLNATENLTVRHPDCGHDFPADVREEAYRVIRAVLLKNQAAVISK